MLQQILFNKSELKSLRAVTGLETGKKILLRPLANRNQKLSLIIAQYNFFSLSPQKVIFFVHPQPAFTCSKLTKKTLEQGMKYVQSYYWSLSKQENITPSFSESKSEIIFNNRTIQFSLSASSESHLFCLSPAGIYLLKVNKRNTGTRCEICSKLALVLVFLSLTLNMKLPAGSYI